MRSRYRTALALAAVAVITGCHNSPGRRQIAANDSALAPTPDLGGSTLAAAPPTRSTTFVDRHPVLFKPREYYENSGDNKIVKATAATVIGVPVGIFGELKQIVVGAPTQQKF